MHLCWTQTFLEYIKMNYSCSLDWMPTVLSAAGGTPDPNLDGIDQWDSLKTGGASKRTEFVYNIDEEQPQNVGQAAIRMGGYKLIDGYPGQYQGWYKPDRAEPGYYSNKTANIVPRNSTKMMLFNLKDDPNERVDLSNRLPDVTSRLKSRLDEYHKQIVPANFPPFSKSAAMQNSGGFWTPGWC